MAADKPGAKVTADTKRNRLYITLSCDPGKKVLEKVYTDVRFCVADLKPGFDVVTDLSQCTLGHLNGIATLRKIMNYLVIHQPGEVIRVTGKMSLLFKQLIRISTKFSGYKPFYVTTLEEAENKLSQSTRRNGLRFHLQRQQLKFSVDREEGEGNLVDISISGCGVQGATRVPPAGKEITLTIPLLMDRDDPVTFTIAAKVIRVENDLFAAEFSDLDQERKKQLYKCLAYEARRDLPED
jgi:hypothetical protein